MFKYIFFLTLFIPLGSFAQSDKGPYHYSLEQGLNERAISISTKTFEKSEKELPFNAERFNAQNVINFFFGLQNDEFEEKEGLFVRNLTPSAHLTWLRRFSLHFGYELDAQVTKNNFIARQTLMAGSAFGAPREIFALAQVGEKVALTSQVNSGYFFVNVGAGWIEKWSFGYRSDLRFYVSNLEYQLWGYELKILKKLPTSEFGIYLGIEQYNPLQMDYERQGQTSSRFGLMFSY